MYQRACLLDLQHAIVLQCLKDISTPLLRLKYWEEAWEALKDYAPLYHMTRSEMVKNAIRSGFIKEMTESEVDKYGE